jgi:hypothetical protein
LVNIWHVVSSLPRGAGVGELDVADLGPSALAVSVPEVGRCGDAAAETAAFLAGQGYDIPSYADRQAYTPIVGGSGVQGGTTTLLLDREA